MIDHNPDDNAVEPKCQCCAGSAERRSAPRFPFNSAVTLVSGSGRRLNGMGVNISSCGMLVRLESCEAQMNGDNAGHDCTIPFEAGEMVTVDVEFDGCCEKPILRWGIGRVVRAEGQNSAIYLSGGTFGVEDGCEHANAEAATVTQNKTFRRDRQVAEMLIEKIPNLSPGSKERA